MRNGPNKLGNSLAAFIGLGIFVVLLICAIVVFSYIFLIGAAIGLVLFIIGFIRAKFSGKKQSNGSIQSSKSSHRIIDQDK